MAGKFNLRSLQLVELLPAPWPLWQRRQQPSWVRQGLPQGSLADSGRAFGKSVFLVQIALPACLGVKNEALLLAFQACMVELASLFSFPVVMNLK